MGSPCQGELAFAQQKSERFVPHRFEAPASKRKGRRKERSVVFPALTQTGKTECSEFHAPPHQTEAQRSGFGLERKKESTDMELSRLLRKPRKRNDVDFF